MVTKTSLAKWSKTLTTNMSISMKEFKLCSTFGLINQSAAY